MAGTVTLTSHEKVGRFGKIVMTCVADASDGSFPATNLPAFSGRLIGLHTNPGATAPTDNYDITLIDPEGIDRLQGVGANRHESTTQQVPVVYSSTSVPPLVVGEALALTLANNSVNSAIVVVQLFYEQ